MGLDVKLTARQETLLSRITTPLRVETALEYIKGGYQNKTAAYIKACKTLKKKPSKNPEVSACEILSYPNVEEFIDSVKHQAAESVNIDAAYVLGRLKEIDQLDIIDIVKDDLSGFLPLSEWPKSWRTSISALDMKRMVAHNEDDGSLDTVVEKIKWPDKTKNLELIGKHISVKAFEGGVDNQEGESLNISFNVSEPVKDIRVTRGENGA